MNLTRFIQNLQKLEAEGYGELLVMYRHGSSGDCGPLGGARVSNEVDDDTGPFDLEPGQKYISIHAGN